MNATNILCQPTNIPATLQELGLALGAQTHHDANRIDLGNQGYIQFYQLSQHIRIVIADLKLDNDLQFNKDKSCAGHFALHINEILDNQVVENDTYLATGKIITEIRMGSNDQPTNYVYPGGIHFRTVKVYFELESLKELIGYPGIESIIQSYFENTNNKQLKSMPLDAGFRQLMDEMMNKSSDHDFKNHFLFNRANLLLERFFGKLIGSHTHTPGRKLSVDEISRLKMIEGILIQNHTDLPPTIEKLSKIAAMSPTKLKQDFKSLYGHAIYEYFQKNRMTKAKQMIMEGNCTIKEIGSRIGYTNISHFAKAFKKEFGILPGTLK
jgi:AraC-like DNA-binding protein